MGLLFFKGINHYIKKETFNNDFRVLQTESFCSVPLKCASIAESEPIVGIGDEVVAGQLLAKPSSRFGIKIYSPVCGKILNIFGKLNSDGEVVKHILISVDKTKNEFKDLPQIDSVNDVDLLVRLQDSGIVDSLSKMPSFLKYSFSGSKTYNELLIVMDSTDPNFSVYETLAKYHMEEIVNGAKYFMNLTNAKEITFVFNDSNEALANNLYKHIKENKKNYDFKIKFIPNKYPLDNPYLMAKIICGKKINKKNNFLSAGVAIETAESCFNFCRAVEFNKPVTYKMVSVDGNNIKKKGNYIVPIGMSYSELLTSAGVDDVESEVKLITGNLLSGNSECSDDLSVNLLTNAIIELKYEPYEQNKEMPCISCGKCQKVCPIGLNPTALDQAFIDRDYKLLEKLKVDYCIDCGCCSYVCPSKRYLSQRISSAKVFDKNKKMGGEK